MKNKNDICNRLVELQLECIKVSKSIYESRGNPNLYSNMENEKGYLEFIKGQISTLHWVLEGDTV